MVNTIGKARDLDRLSYQLTEHYREGKRPGEIKLSTDRKFLILNGNQITSIY